MAGGRGERFWPLSRVSRPKHVIPLPDGRTLLQEAMARLDFPSDRTLIVTGADCADEVRRQAAALPPANILVEPVGRDTAPAIALSARALPAGAVFVVMPADQVITDTAAFRRAVATALDRAETGALVTIGLRPRAPETTWGYIERGAGFAVKRFHEKPDRATAERYVAAGNYFWNAGIFAWRRERILEEIARHAPALVDLSDWNALPKISIDYAVMEKADRVEVVEAGFDLVDVGNWEAFARVFPSEAPGAVDADGCIVVSDDPDHLVAVFGARDLVVVRTADATLVCPRGSDLKTLVEALRARGLQRYL